MKKIYLIFGIFFLVLSGDGQPKKDIPSFFFAKHQPLTYQKAKITQLIDTTIENKLLQIQVKGVKGMVFDQIHLLELERTTEASQIILYRQNKVVQKLQVPFWFLHILPAAEIADFNGDGIPDIKFRIYTGGNGSAALLNYKVFLMSQQNKYRVFSFVDFSAEKEYDFNKDGIAEILGCTTTNYKGHNYWVYNVYNWVNGSLVMVSKDFGYPIWTKVDFKTNKIIAKEIPDEIRITTLLSFPTEYFVR